MKLLVMLFSGFLLHARADITPGLHHADDTIPKCVEGDPVAMYHFRPGCQEWVVRAGSRSWMRYNSMGLRGKDYSAKPAPGTRRILFVGSSALAAPGIAEDEAPPQRLEHYLKKRWPKTEVINAGVEGYFALQSATQLPRLLERYSPTHVIFWGNFASGAMMDSILEQDLVRKGDAPERIGSPVQDLLDKVAPLRWWASADPKARFPYLRTWVDMILRWRDSVRCTYRFRDDALREAGCLLGPSLRASRFIREASERAGAKFLLLYLPTEITNNLTLPPGMDLELARRFDRITPRIRLNGSFVSPLLDAEGIPHVGLNPGLVSSDAMLPGDHHFNREGADRFSRSLAEAVSASFWELKGESPARGKPAGRRGGRKSP